MVILRWIECLIYAQCLLQICVFDYIQYVCKCIKKMRFASIRNTNPFDVQQCYINVLLNNSLPLEFIYCKIIVGICYYFFVISAILQLRAISSLKPDRFDNLYVSGQKVPGLYVICCIFSDFLSGDFMPGDFLVGDFMSYVTQIGDFYKILYLAH